MTNPLTDPERIANAIKLNANLYCDNQIPHEEFDTIARSLWDQAAAAGVDRQVAQLVAPPLCGIAL